MKAYTLRKIEISMFILFYIFPKKLDYIKNLRKYCDSIIEKYLLIFDIRSIESIEVSTLQIDSLLGQFLQKSMSALERFGLYDPGFSQRVHITISQIRYEIEHIRTYLRPVLALRRFLLVNFGWCDMSAANASKSPFVFGDT